MKRKAWVQAAVDVDDYGTAKQIARMAYEAGAEWIEVGHPLLMKYGFEAIRVLRDALGPDAKIVADFKNEMAGDYLKEVKEAGADYAIVTAAYADFLIKAAVENGKKYGITPIFFVDTRCDLFPERFVQVAQMGAKYMFMHRYYSNIINGVNETYDHIARMKKATDCIIGVSSDNYDEALSAIDEGADWITFGRILKKPDEKSCRQWIDGIHGHIPKE